MNHLTYKKFAASQVGPDEPTRAEMKRRMDRLQDLGLRLTELPSGKLERLDLPEKLRDAVDEARRLTSMGAIRRQIQYIGRIMEEFDAPAIARSLRDVDSPVIKSTSAAATATSSEMILAEELIKGGDEALFARLGQRLERSQMQEIRQAMRTAAKNMANGKKPEAETAQLANVCSRIFDSQVLL